MWVDPYGWKILSESVKGFPLLGIAYRVIKWKRYIVLSFSTCNTFSGQKFIYWATSILASFERRLTSALLVSESESGQIFYRLLFAGSRYYFTWSWSSLKTGWGGGSIFKVTRTKLDNLFTTYLCSGGYRISQKGVLTPRRSIDLLFGQFLPKNARK